MRNNLSVKNEDTEILKIDRETIKFGLYNISSILIASIFSFFASIIIARVLSIHLNGIYIFILAISNIFSIFSIPGLKTVIFKTSSQNFDGTYKKAVKLSFEWSFISFILLILISIYFLLFDASLYHYEIGISLLIIGIFSPINYSLEMYKIVLKGKQKFNISFYFTLIISITQFGLIFLTLIILDLESIILLVLIFVFLKVFFNIIFTKYSKRYLTNNLIDHKWKNQGYALSILDLSSIVFNSIDSFLIGVFLSLESVATYGIALSVGNIFLLIIVSFIEVFLPRLYKSKNDFLLKDIFIFFLLGFGISILLGFIIEFPIILLYTQKYSDAVFYCRIYLYIIPFRILSAFFGPYLIKHNMNKEINLSKIITITFTITSYLLLIPQFGIIGAVISSIGFYIVQDIIMTIMLINHKKIQDK